MAGPVSRPAPRDPADALPPPGWLSPREAMLWLEIVKDAVRLKPIDSALLGALVVARDLHRQAVEAVAEQGMVVTGISGREVPHPALKLTTQQAALVLQLSEALGLTPSGRQRLGIKGGAPLERTLDENGEPQESLDEYLARDPSPKLH